MTRCLPMNWAGRCGQTEHLCHFCGLAKRPMHTKADSCVQGLRDRFWVTENVTHSVAQQQVGRSHLYPPPPKKNPQKNSCKVCGLHSEKENKQETTPVKQNKHHIYCFLLLLHHLSSFFTLAIFSTKRHRREGLVLSRSCRKSFAESVDSIRATNEFQIDWATRCIMLGNRIPLTFRQ